MENISFINIIIIIIIIVIIIIMIIVVIIIIVEMIVMTIMIIYKVSNIFSYFWDAISNISSSANIKCQHGEKSFGSHIESNSDKGTQMHARKLIIVVG